MRQQYQRSSAILLLISALIATVASVPTSVLVQNSELSATNNDIASLNNLKLKNNPINKVKRSSENGKSENILTSTVSAVDSNNGFEKKSSPEVVPAAYNLPPRPLPISSQGMVDKVSYGLPENPELINTAIAAGLTAAAVEAAAVAHQRDLEQSQVYEDEQPPTLLHKRGITTEQQQAYTFANDDGYYNNPFLNSVLSSSQLPGGGVWADDLDPAPAYNDIQELDEYAPLPMQHGSSYHNKAYDNLQSLLNAEAYLQPIALPYSSRYYSSIDADRRKRANPIKYNRYSDSRSSKRDVTPADMLALVALVEAGERSRKEDSENPAPASMYGSSNLPSRNYFGNNVGAYDYPSASLGDDVSEDFIGSNSVSGVYDPASVVDYYGTPINVEAMPKYDFVPQRDYKHSGRNRLSVKRFMVAKKSRPLGNFLNEPVAKPSISFNVNDDNYF